MSAGWADDHDMVVKLAFFQWAAVFGCSNALSCDFENRQRVLDLANSRAEGS